jgi:hypothetical protein
MTNEIRMPNLMMRSAASFVIRHSGFVISAPLAS